VKIKERKGRERGKERVKKRRKGGSSRKRMTMRLLIHKYS